MTQAARSGGRTSRRDYPGIVILGLDTSIGTSVAVVERDGAVLSQVASGDPRGHAELIGTLIAKALREASATPSAITHVAAGMGPGPFTGLRVGIAAARTFAQGRGVPFVPVVSHDAVALGVLLLDALADGFDEGAQPDLAVVTDARRREVAFTVYRGLDDDGLPVRVTQPALAPVAEVDASLGPAVRHDAHAVPGGMIGVLAARALVAGRVIGPDDALYLRSPDVTLAPPRTIAPASPTASGAPQ